MKMLAIDPGKSMGWAWYEGDRLCSAGTEHPDDPDVEGVLDALTEGYGSVFGLVVIEQPRWYPHERKIDVNDLLDLSVLVGEVKAYFDRYAVKVELVYPRTWKGTVPKEIHNRRVLAALRPEELAAVPKRKRGGHDHNCVDAVGLGLWKLGRM